MFSFPLKFFISLLCILAFHCQANYATENTTETPIPTQRPTQTQTPTQAQETPLREVAPFQATTKLFIPEESSNMTYVQDFMKMLMILAGIIILMLLSAWGLKKLLAQRMEILNKENSIKILERRVINQKTVIYLLEIPGKQIVVGESPAGLTCLAEIVNNHHKTPHQEEKASGPKSFGDILQRKMHPEG